MPTTPNFRFALWRVTILCCIKKTNHQVIVQGVYTVDTLFENHFEETIDYNELKAHVLSAAWDMHSFLLPNHKKEAEELKELITRAEKSL